MPFTNKDLDYVFEQLEEAGYVLDDGKLYAEIGSCGDCPSHCPFAYQESKQPGEYGIVIIKDGKCYEIIDTDGQVGIYPVTDSQGNELYYEVVVW